MARPKSLCMSAARTDCQTPTSRSVARAFAFEFSRATAFPRRCGRGCSAGFAQCSAVSFPESRAVRGALCCAARHAHCCPVGSVTSCARLSAARSRSRRPNRPVAGCPAHLAERYAIVHQTRSPPRFRVSCDHQGCLLGGDVRVSWLASPQLGLRAELSTGSPTRRRAW